MKVKLLNYTPLSVADIAICKCYSNIPHTEESKRINRIKRVANGNGDRTTKHSSVIEHLYYNFDIDGISRACLQELARHRIASYTVKSSRYTLQELKNESKFLDEQFIPDYERVKKYVVLTDDEDVNFYISESLESLRVLITKNKPNDIAKYNMPEAYKTSLVWSINARSLQNFLSLRTDKKALWEIQLLAKSIYEALPEEHKPLFEEFIK